MKRRLIFAAVLLLALLGSLSLWLYTAATTPAAVRGQLARLAGARAELSGVERLWLPPGVIVRGLRLDAPGYRLEVDRLEIRLALLPLLGGRVAPRSLTLGGARLALAEGDVVLPALPPEAAWDIRGVEVRGLVAGRDQPLFYLDHATLGAVAGERRPVELVGGASPSAPRSVRLEGEAGRSLADGRYQLRLDALPAQPLLGYLTGDERLLGTAKLFGAWTLAGRPGAATLEGDFRATASDADELLAGRFRLQATPERVTLDSLDGHLVGNRFAARGHIENWQDPQRRVALALTVTRARLEDDTLHFLHEVWGREALGFAESLRGEFSAELDFEASPDQHSLTGEIELRGLSAAPAGLPALHDLRGRLRLEGDRLRLENVTGRLLDTPARISGEVRGQQLALRLEADDVPLTHLPVAFNATLPVANLAGGLDLEAAINGTFFDPQVSGRVRLAGGGFDFRRVEVREVAGTGVFDARELRFEPLTGRAGACRFTLSARFAPAAWRDTLEADGVAPDCELAELIRLADAAGLGPVPLFEPETLSGTGRLEATYAQQRWQADLEIADARWSPAGLALPVEDIRARLRLDAESLKLRRASVRLGTSTLMLRGQIGRLDQPAAPWELDIETSLAAADAERLLPHRWRAWLQVPSDFEGSARLTGSPQTGFAVAARLEAPVETATGSDSDPPPAAAASPTRRLELEAAWRRPVFEVKRFTAHLGAAELSATGELHWGEEKNVALNLTAPAGTPLPELLAFVRLPESLRSVEGALAADLTLAGAPGALAWTGAVDLAEVSVPGLLTRPVRLNGRLRLDRGGIELEEIDVAQPLGRFALTGRLENDGVSRLQARGAWLNLDRLLGQLPNIRLEMPAGDFLARHPLVVALGVRQVRFLDLTFADVEGTLTQQDGEFRLLVPAFGLGTGTGRLEVGLDGASRQVSLSLALEDTQTETVLVDVLKMEPTVAALLSLDAELTGPLGSREEFLRGADGEIRFDLGRGRLQKGTLPERLFALAVLLREGFYGFGFLRLARLANPPGLRSFHDWQGTVTLEQGKAQVDTQLTADVYDVTLTGRVDLASTAFEMHGEGDFHPGWQFDLSLKSFVDGLARLFRLASGRHGQPFEFDVAGELGGQKRVQKFRFKD